MIRRGWAFFVSSLSLETDIMDLVMNFRDDIINERNSKDVT